MEKINMPSDNSIQEENVNSKPEIISDISNDEEKNEQSKNNYDQPASQEEISGLSEEIEKKVENKANELNISKEKLIELANLDLESLYAKNLKGLNHGGIEFIRDSINEAINEFWRNKKTGKLITADPLIIDKLLKFTREHKKFISLSELAIYAASFGPAVLKDLAGDNVKVEIYGEKISLKDLADNPKLIETIDRAHNHNSPIDILADFSPPESFEYKNVKFSFDSNDKVNDNNIVERIIYFDQTAGNFEKLHTDLEEIGVSLKYEDGGCLMDDFLENKNEIINIFSRDLNISEHKVEKYIESWIMRDISNISVVEFEDFKINKNLEIPEDAMKLQQIKKEIYEKHNVYSEEWVGKNSENGLKAEKELEKWGKENGYEDFDKELYKEIKENNENPINKLKVLKFQENIEYENSESFKKIVIDVFEKEGYDISTLKEIAEDNPEEVIKIISEVIGKNVKYDYIEAKLDYISEDLKDIYQKNKHSKGIPYITLESGKGVCHDYGITFVAVKNVLEEEGVSNLESFVSLTTVSEKHNHMWNAVVTVDPNNPDKIIVSYIDPTRDDSLMGKLNAVDEKHYYTNIREKIDKTHQKALEKIEDYNILAFQEKLKEILTQYDPKSHKRDRQIEGNEALREQDKDVEALREERTENVKGSLKNVRNKFKKIHAEKDSKNE